MSKVYRYTMNKKGAKFDEKGEWVHYDDHKAELKKVASKSKKKKK